MEQASAQVRVVVDNIVVIMLPPDRVATLQLTKAKGPPARQTAIVQTDIPVLMAPVREMQQHRLAEEMLTRVPLFAVQVLVPVKLFVRPARVPVEGRSVKTVMSIVRLRQMSHPAVEGVAVAGVEPPVPLHNVSG